MKTPAIFGIVVLAHCLAIGGIIMIQGCDTTRGGGSGIAVPEDTVIMPPASIDPVAVKPVIKPVVKHWPKETTEYVVKPGDSISKIASRYGVTSAEIVSLNGISNKNVIRVGQRLMLPGKINVAKPAARVRTSSSSTVKTVKVSGGTYVVKPGDSLSVIASNHGVKTDAIRQANGLSGDKILVGQKLIIPGVKIKPAAAKPKPVVRSVAKPPESVDVTKQEDVKVPAPASTAVAAVQESQVQTEKPKTVITETHVVQKGEDLRRISMQWLVSEDKIRKHNNLSGDTLQPGKVLLIPLSE